MSFVPLPRLVAPTQPPLFRYDERAVDEAFGQIQFAPLLEVGGKRFEDVFEETLTHPALVAAMTGLVGWIALWQVCPLRAGAQDPQNAVEHLTAAAPRPSTPICSAWHLANEWL
jgi:hypothetical protein